MLLYRVEVRDYTYDIEPLGDGSVKSVRIQSPSLTLEGVRPPFIALLLQGNNQARARLVPDVSTIRDDIHEHSYEADAHGVTVQPGDGSIVHPVWTYQKHLFLKSPYPIDVVDLFNYQETTLSACHVCWVPHLESPEGLTFTLLDSLTKDGNANSKKAVVVQRPGFPQATEIEYKEAASLRKLLAVREPRKNDIFHVQLRAIRRMFTPRGEPFIPKSVGSGLSELLSLVHWTLKRSRTLLTSSSHTERSAQDQVADYWDLWSDCTSDDSASLHSDENSGDETLEEPPPPTMRRMEFCCNYPRLAPSLGNLRPSHWHKQDDECPLGSAHPKHCVFAQAFPEDCVVDEPRHVCCPPLIPGSSISTPDPVDSNQCATDSCAATAEDLTPEPPSQQSEDPGAPRPPADDGELDVFGELPLLDPGLEYLEAPTPEVSCSGCLPAPEAAASWPEMDAMDRADDGLSPVPDLAEPELMAFDDDYGGDGSEIGFVELQAGTACHSWGPAVHLDALPSTPAPPDMPF